MENIASAKFCGGCAAGLFDPRPVQEASGREPSEPARGGAADGERKTVTALFADIKGSVELMADLDPEDARALIDPALGIMVDAVRAFDGYVVQSTGDGIFALFGAPAAYEDHPQRAVYAALQMQKALREHAGRFATQGGPALEARVGVNSGEVVVRSLETGGRLEYNSIGHTSNLASRLQTVAPPGAVVVSEHTSRLVEGYFDLRTLAPAPVKGMSKPLALFEVVRPGALRSHFELSQRRGLSKFVGRAAELGLMRRALEQAAAGRGQVVAVVSDAGAGKSRLVYEFCRSLPAGCRLLETYSVSHGRAAAWGPVVVLMRRCFGIAADDDEAARRRRIGDRLAALGLAEGDMAPHLFALMGVAEESDGLGQMDPRVRRLRTLEAISGIVRAEGLAQTLVLVFEDLHWIDEQTRSLLDTLVDMLAEAPAEGEGPRVLLLVTCRPQHRHGWAGKGCCTELRLETLPPEGADELLSSLLAGAADPEPLKRLIIERTGGNPLFIEEMVRALREEGALARDGGAVPLNRLRIPPTVQGILAERIDRLPAKQKELLQILSVVGRRLPLSVVRQVAAETGPGLEPMLADLEAAEFICEQPQAGQAGFLFKHALTQEVAYTSLLSERRKSLHGLVGAALERVFAETVGDHLVDIAYHYECSDDAAKAVEYLGRAGRQAMQRAAHAEAVAALGSAIRLAQKLPDTPGRMQQELTLLIALGVALQTTKGYASADVEDAYGRARELAERIGDPAQLVSVLLGQALFYNVRARYRTASGLGERILQVGAHDRAYLGEGRLALGWASLYLGDLRESERHFRQRLLLSDTERPADGLYYAGDSRAKSLSYFARTLWLLGYPDQALVRSRQALSLARELDMPLTLAQAKSMHALLHRERREFAQAEERCDDAIAYATAQGMPYWLTLSSILKGWLLNQRGAGDEGVSRFEQGLQGYRATGAKLGLSWFLALRGELLAKSGRIDEGLAAIDEALSHIDAVDERYYEAEVHRLRGELQLQRGQAGAESAAEASFLRSLETARRQHAKSWELRTATSLARLRLRQDRRREAADVLEPVYAWFTEGFETADLQDARRVLDEAAAAAVQAGQAVRG